MIKSQETQSVILTERLAQWEKLVEWESRHSAPSEQCVIVGLSEVRRRGRTGGGGEEEVSIALEGEKDGSQGEDREGSRNADQGGGGENRGEGKRSVYRHR